MLLTGCVVDTIQRDIFANLDDGEKVKTKLLRCGRCKKGISTDKKHIKSALCESCLVKVMKGEVPRYSYGGIK